MPNPEPLPGRARASVAASEMVGPGLSPPPPSPPHNDFRV